ncbi:hypothetical protein HFU84_03120 [Acidithiobacillus sp. CV18-2]|uniref:Thioredoxin-like fold domain-containing protein n=1 Tax=Igneacidithiobacillus copahuensis TaxID=2724909 RepID=A0AAE3CJC6_9PROT|nr:hypothetical protein [Igneacidithiobacillus copahuensis]MBU2753462.1 hypothetical protein [Acidithiobacillus sp. CV18-3]MBU2756685.1 hypothetical protein [Acidithiobacillus sp. BN09-2]MBU2776507.1 hypothetical protein [Acidithiobacillus sp. CV18-2]MBU2797720.1 hypothetical protein [Acidithiobacillus sp. VAN18-2]MBU2800602.1 hypothetical protein [Acidithiobacillus sp. VAN18-4]
MSSFSVPGNVLGLVARQMLCAVCGIGMVLFALSAWAAQPSAIFTHSGSSLEKILQQGYAHAHQLHPVAEGPGNKPAVVVFFDPLCVLGAQEWQTLQPYRQQLHILWVPVGTVKPQSLAYGAKILSATEPLEALAQQEEQLSKTGPSEKPAGPTPQVASYWLAVLYANTQYWRRSFGVLPLLLYPSRQGIRAVYGKIGAEQMHDIVQTVLSEKTTSPSHRVGGK